jgi:CubicO group peptidase (beta-lactamase class C family)
MPETYPRILFSAGAIVSTPNDMAKFLQALFDGRIVSKENLTLMKTMRDGEGLGMEPFQFVGRTFYEHTGGATTTGRGWLTCRKKSWRSPILPTQRFTRCATS